MKQYDKFKVEDFASDDYFIEWCLKPKKTSDFFWKNWIKDNPQQMHVIQTAKDLVLDLNIMETEDKEIDFEQAIWDKIDKSIEQEDAPNEKRKILHWTSIAAACLILIFGISSQLQKYIPTSQSNPSSEWVNLKNDSGLTKTIVLSDKTTINLEPFSVLKYPKTFSKDQRRVFLKGEAFFDVARDTTRPFLVYANETITKVLGTSFRIKAFEGQKTVEVDVVTGKVAVYANVASNKKSTKPEKQIKIDTDETILIPLPNKKLEVTPNQKVVFDKGKEDMIKQVTKLPKLITKVEKLPQFEFNDAPVVQVFEAIEEAYGINLNYNKESLVNCTITTRLEDEPLFEKLNIICIALDLEYEQDDGSINIEGKPCN